MKTKHTQGKWYVYNEEEILSGKESIGIDCVFDNGEKATIICWDDDFFGDPISPEQRLSNAKLIAAAPDLLEALEYIKEVIKVSFINNEPVDDSTLEVAEKAIKKATS